MTIIISKGAVIAAAVVIVAPTVFFALIGAYVDRLRKRRR
jgi:hypothetical protein